MAAIRSRLNKTTELAVVKELRSLKIKGWRRHPKNLVGKPDFVFFRLKTVLFVDGCFWHGCPKHATVPRTNTLFWANKIGSNQRRDKIVNKELKSEGWRVLRIWEHDSRDKIKINKILTKYFSV